MSEEPQKWPVNYVVWFSVLEFKKIPDKELRVYVIFI